MKLKPSSIAVHEIGYLATSNCNSVLRFCMQADGVSLSFYHALFEITYEQMISKLRLLNPWSAWPFPDNKVHGANMGPIWGRQDPGGPHVGPTNLAIWVIPAVYNIMGMSHDGIRAVAHDICKLHRTKMNYMYIYIYIYIHIYIFDTNDACNCWQWTIKSNQTFYVDAICHFKALHFYMYKVHPGV